MYGKTYDTYVLRKSWIWTIHGLSCANRGSRFERTNRGSLAQSVDVGQTVDSYC